jgi:hypothetical protein
MNPEIVPCTPTPDATPLTDLPPATLALLRDEANLSTAKQVLEDARNDCLTRQDTIRAQRPPLGFLATKKHRDEYTASLLSIDTQIQAIDAMLTRVASARDRLQSPLRVGLIDHLAKIDPIYRHGVGAARLNDHWIHAHSVIVDRLRAFVRDVKHVKNAFAADAAQGRSRHSGDAVWRLTETRKAAGELEQAIAQVNQLSAEHAAYVAKTPFSEIRLPALEPWDSLQRVDVFYNQTPLDADKQSNEVLAEYLEYRQPSLDTVVAMARAAGEEQAQIAEKRLRDQWSALLKYAEAHLVAETELEPTLADIERRQLENERAKLSAEVPNRPFSAER